MSVRNADGQFPKKFFHDEKKLHEQLGFSAKETESLARRWNTLQNEHYALSKFLQQCDLRFTKHELLLLFSLALGTKVRADL